MSGPPRVLRLALALVVLFIGMIMLTPVLFAYDTTYLQIIVAIAAGWIAYPARAMANVHPTWTLAELVVFIPILILGTHGFVKWVLNANRHELDESAGGRSRWSLRQTLRVYGIFFATLAAGMMIMGIGHQTAWLLTAPVPISQKRPKRMAEDSAMNLRAIGYGLLQYAGTHENKMPDDLGVVLMSGDVAPELLVDPSSKDSPPTGNTPAELADSLRRPGRCSYLYFCKRQKLPESTTITAIEPPKYFSDQGILALYGDGHVDWIPINQAAPILLSHGFGQVPGTAGYNVWQDQAP